MQRPSGSLQHCPRCPKHSIVCRGNPTGDDNGCADTSVRDGQQHTHCQRGRGPGIFIRGPVLRPRLLRHARRLADPDVVDGTIIGTSHHGPRRRRLYGVPGRRCRRGRGAHRGRPGQRPDVRRRPGDPPHRVGPRRVQLPRQRGRRRGQRVHHVQRHGHAGQRAGGGQLHRRREPGLRRGDHQRQQVLLECRPRGEHGLPAQQHQRHACFVQLVEDQLD